MANKKRAFEARFFWGGELATWKQTENVPPCIPLLKPQKRDVHDGSEGAIMCRQ